jgi:hypothetical protein
MLKARYSAIVLTDASRRDLLMAITHLLMPLLENKWQMQNSPPAGVEPENLPHHMTICLGELPLEQKDLIGTNQQMVATHWGQNDQAAAVRVRCDIASTNETKHITAAISPIGKPFHSNYITEWVKLEKEVLLSGIVKEVA